MDSRSEPTRPDLGRDVRRVKVHPRTIPLFVEDHAGMFLLGAVFFDLYDSGQISIVTKLERSSTLGTAQRVLLDSLARAVAVVFNAGTDDPIEIAEQRGRIERVLAQASIDGWHVALATPDVAAWVRLDPRYEVLLAAEGDPVTRAKACFEFAKTHGLDRKPLRDGVEEFRELEDFLLRNVKAPATAVTTRP
jgi:hypothetical protein